MSLRDMTDEQLAEADRVARENAHQAPRAMAGGTITGDAWARTGQVFVETQREILRRREP